ncbi:ras family-domain-containing protein [Mycena filopes]|nr:ras family-domain-containing protein [Mycena filopes]
MIKFRNLAVASLAPFTIRSVNSAARMDEWTVGLLGDSCVGTTGLAVRFAFDILLSNWEPIVEETYHKQFVVDDRMCVVRVMDMVRTEGYTTPETWFQPADGFLLMYSIGSRSTFDAVESWLETAKRVSHRAEPVCMLIGSRADWTAESERAVMREEGEAKARRLGCDFMEVCAADENVEEAFVGVVRRLRERYGAGLKAAESVRLSEKKNLKQRVSKCIIS